MTFRPMNLIDAVAGDAALSTSCFCATCSSTSTAPTKTEILERVRRVLRPDGYLFLGAAETTLNLHDGYERVALERAGCYRIRP